MNASTSDAAAQAETTSPHATKPLPPRLFQWLIPFGAGFRDDGELDFGDVRSEAAAALDRDILAPLADRRFIRASGADADSFLQGQLSNDLRELTPDRAQLSSYNSPKGRVLAVFTLLRRPEAIWLETDHSIFDGTLKRLRMFVLRAKLKIEDAGADAVALGLSGPNADALLREAGMRVPAIVWACAESEGVAVVRRPGSGPRYTLHGNESRLQSLWPLLAAKAKPAGTQAWRLLDILAGLPAVHSETSDRHVAQMLNLDTAGGISFAKGCYPGQEIVARLHYLGNLKRRLFLGHATASRLTRGASVYADDHDSAVGEVLDFAPHPSFGQSVQFVLQLSHREAAKFHVGTQDGPELTLAN